MGENTQGENGFTRPNAIVRFFSKLVSPARHVERQSNSVHVAPETLSAVSLNHFLQPGAQIPVVGTYFYEESFKKLSFLVQSHGSEFLKSATLVNEPNNSFSKNGKAVSVRVGGFQVGHISESISEIVFDSLIYLGGSAECRSTVDLRTEPGRYKFSEVFISMSLPPMLESDAKGAYIKTIKFGSKQMDLGFFELIPGIEPLVDSLNDGDSFLTPVNLVFSDDKLIIQTVAGETFLTSQILNQAARDLGALACELLYVYARVSSKQGRAQVEVSSSDPLSLSKQLTGESVTAAGNVASSRFELAMPSTGSWVPLINQEKYLALRVEDFRPNFANPKVYWWATLSPRGTFMTSWNFSAKFYESFLSPMKSKLDNYPYFKVLIRGTWNLANKKVTYEADFDLKQPLQLMPSRPIIPNKALTTRTPSLTKRVSKEPKPLQQPRRPELSYEFDFATVGDKNVVNTSFDDLESIYLLPALKNLGLKIGNLTKTQTAVLIGGNLFQVEDSAKARDAANNQIPIITTQTARKALESKLKNDPIYQALTRYEEWLSLNGAQPPFVQGAIKATVNLEGAELVLIPGAAIHGQDYFENISFYGDVVGLEPTKKQLNQIFHELGGQKYDTLLVKVPVTYKETKSGLSIEFTRNGIYLGRTPASQTDSLAESAQLYKLREVWVRINWISDAKFTAKFSFFGSN